MIYCRGKVNTFSQINVTKSRNHLKASPLTYIHHTRCVSHNKLILEKILVQTSPATVVLAGLYSCTPCVAGIYSGKGRISLGASEQLQPVCKEQPEGWHGRYRSVHGHTVMRVIKPDCGTDSLFAIWIISQ